MITKSILHCLFTSMTLRWVLIVSFDACYFEYTSLISRSVLFIYLFIYLFFCFFSKVQMWAELEHKKAVEDYSISSKTYLQQHVDEKKRSLLKRTFFRDFSYFSSFLV